MQVIDELLPSDIGFDSSEFPQYRTNPVSNTPVQLEAIDFAISCEERFCTMCIPCGVGKSLIAASIQKITGLRTVILTGTKSLQEQYLNDFGKYGLAEIKGRSNYDCLDWRHLDCRAGAMVGCKCTGGKGCQYEIARDRAKNAQMVIANYAYWMTINDHAGGLQRSNEEAKWKGDNPVELLILDEGDIADQWLESYLNTYIFERELKRWGDPKKTSDNIKVFKEIAKSAVLDLEAEIKIEKERIVKLQKSKVTKDEVDNLHKLENLYQKYDRINNIKEGEWVLELKEGTRYGRMWHFQVVWPGRYSEQYLFCGVPKVILMSGTIRPKTMGLLGVKRELYKFKEWDRVFPANRNPIYNAPARKDNGNGTVSEIRIDRRTKPDEMLAWVEHIDRIIDGRMDRKGILQTVSYARQQFIMDNSRHTDIMVGNTADPESDTAMEAAERFRNMEAPALLVSPSFGRGWNFPYCDCEYVIVCKVPFRPNQGKVMKARENKDKSYGPYVAMQELIQSSLRGMRSFDDRCEIIIVDGHLNWFLYQNKHLASGWFVRAVRKIAKLDDIRVPEKL